MVKSSDLTNIDENPHGEGNNFFEAIRASVFTMLPYFDAVRGTT